MAKDRQGSVDIYGPMQAQTAEGIVVFTDGIARENADGSVQFLEEILNELGGIKDVTELPKEGWKGTTVPNTGYVEKVYFNTKLSVEEVVERLDKILFYEVTGIADCKLYYPIIISDVIIWILKNENGYAISIFNEQKTLFSNFSNDYIENLNGWSKDYNGEEIVINDEINLDDLSAYGKQNNLISDLVSITPFEKENINDKTLYRVNNINYKSTAVPNNGYIEKVYFNTELSNLEIVNILRTLTYVQTPFANNPIYPILFASDGSPVIFALMYNNTCEINIATDIVNGVYENVYIHSFNESLDGFKLSEYNVSKNVISEYSGLSVGAENDLLSNIISITPFEKEVKSDLYTYDGEWCKLVKEKDLNKILNVKITTINDNGTIYFDKQLDDGLYSFYLYDLDTDIILLNNEIVYLLVRTANKRYVGSDNNFWKYIISGELKYIKIFDSEGNLFKSHTDLTQWELIIRKLV